MGSGEQNPRLAARNPTGNVAAVDLGSNSFHLIIARLVGGDFRVVDRVRERVRIAAGFDEQWLLTPEAQSHALSCLERFAERVRDIPPGYLRAVGTYTFRKARNARAFLRQAGQVLGHPIEVVSAHEESRLIYLGVVHNTAPAAGRRLVIDIGGGSTEFILGEGVDVLEAESVASGCVSLSLRHFADGRLDHESFDNAILAAQIELATPVARLHAMGWRTCFGSSGTAHAIQAILRAIGKSSDSITLAGLRRLRVTMTQAGHIDKVELPTLSPDRRPVLPGGLAILIAAFQELGLERMEAAPGGLREGLLHDLMGRLEHEDIRDRTIRRFVHQFQLDEDQGYRVEKTALDFLDCVRKEWKLEGLRYRQLLSWAARLHEIGLGISHVGYHKHGEYLIANSDMAGFSDDDQKILATLVRGHRRKLTEKRFRELPHLNSEQGVRLCILLRLAVLLHRSRRSTSLPAIELQAGGSNLVLDFPPGWLQKHPLTRAELEKEACFLEKWGHYLVISSASLSEAAK